MNDGDRGPSIRGQRLTAWLFYVLLGLLLVPVSLPLPMKSSVRATTMAGAQTATTAAPQSLELHDFETEDDLRDWREQEVIHLSTEHAYSGQSSVKVMLPVVADQQTEFFHHWDYSFQASRVIARVYWPLNEAVTIVWAQVCVDVEGGCFDLPELKRGQWNTYILNLSQLMGGSSSRLINQMQVPGLVFQGGLRGVIGTTVTTLPIYIDTIEIFSSSETHVSFLPVVRNPSPPKLLFGIGPEADTAKNTPLATDAPVRMLSSWYNGPDDLSWMTRWKQDLVPEAYAAGLAMHLIVHAPGPEVQFLTPYGPACGRTYPVSEQFLDHMRQLAQTFAGRANGPSFYVTLFTEFQTYACIDNAWNPSPEVNAYYRTLQDRYQQTMAIFHQYAPNAKISLGWGGWQARWDEPTIGGGRSMFHYFTDLMRASDFQSFQAMQGDSNVTDVRDMVNMLGMYGPVMLAHYKPDNASQVTFEQDLKTMLTDTYLSDVTTAGLFAWSFMDHSNLSASENIYMFTKHAVTQYGS